MQLGLVAKTKLVVCQNILQQANVSESTSESIFSSYAPTPENVRKNWAKYPENNPYSLPKECMLKLAQLYEIGRASKKKKVSAEWAHQIIIDNCFIDQWDAIVDITIAKIKAFFSLSPAKMKESIESFSIDSDIVDEATQAIVDIETRNEAASLSDIE